MLPEEALRTTIAKDAKLSAEDGFGLLAWFGAESAGSLILRDPGNDVPAEAGVRALSLQGLAPRTATRELDSMLAAMPREAGKLIAAIEAGQGAMLAHCPEPEVARHFFAGELRLLRA
ncbi:hypothetical protein CR103_14810 [Massilia psychrophila]|uniref:Uncharacterized protein n=1 Tax=Massilia psychrophila TaxID=1603353 RepID=A0A2G8SZB0_9BURK|nr:hypothetical protein CR103_14810 [Massilia psychrophila]